MPRTYDPRWQASIREELRNGREVYVDTDLINKRMKCYV